MFTTGDDSQQPLDSFNEPTTPAESPVLPPCAPPSLFSTNDRRKKRNSGHSGPTTIAGRQISSRNALKHGACSQTLILKGESEASWLLLLDLWCQTYNIPIPAPDNDQNDDNNNNEHTERNNPENTLTYNFILKAAQAEWRRIRCQRNYDNYLAILNGRSPYNWSPEELKMHDLLLRYVNAAERTCQRETRALDQHCKTRQQPPPLPPSAPAEPKQNPQPAPPQPEPAPRPNVVTLVGEDPTSPTGYRIAKHIENGREVVAAKGQPYTPPDPLPAHWRTFNFPPGPPKTD